VLPTPAGSAGNVARERAHATSPIGGIAVHWALRLIVLVPHQGDGIAAVVPRARRVDPADELRDLGITLEHQEVGFGSGRGRTNRRDARDEAMHVVTLVRNDDRGVQRIRLPVDPQTGRDLAS
jgi:hypothetical protein